MRVDPFALASLRSAFVALAVCVVAVVFSSCSGGGSGNSGTAPGGTSSLRLVACSIGCATDVPCAGGEIGINEPMVFEFSQPIDVTTVSPSSVNIVATTGETPAGTLVVEGRQVRFQPQVRFANGVTTYGYRANADYLVTITATGVQRLRSQSGQNLATAFSCVVRVKADVVDVDGQPPTVISIVPNPGAVIEPRPSIVIQFSELLDFGAFMNDGASGAPPVEFWVGPSGATPDGAFTCNVTTQLTGSPVLSNDDAQAVTILRFVPEEPLPDESCLAIVITERVRDLAGTPAVRQTIPSMFIGRPGFDRVFRVSFDDDRYFDRGRSSGDWNGGEVVFGRTGGDGRHGDFDPADGAPAGVNTYRWSTDDQTLQAKDTATQNGVMRVTDGRFYFSTFVLPVGVTVDFRGSNPLQIVVRGECRIDGRILCNGERVPDNFNGIISGQPPPAIPPGQTGGVAGAGGGAGGDGGARGDGMGPQTIFDGSDGEDLTVPGTSYWATQPGLASTGGRGSLQFPAHGDNAQLAWFNAFGTFYALETGKGGGGGGFVQAGTAGSIVAVAAVGLTTNNIADQRAGSGAAGLQFDTVVTQPRPVGTSSMDYYLVGGSGGGGGASHPALARQIATDLNPYRAGAAGSGGGGAVFVRAGNGLIIGTTGQIQARGGAGPSSGSVNTLFVNGAPLPGGGGSGGSVMLQTDGGFTQQGLIDVTGGAAGVCQIVGFYSMDVRSGAGSPGHVRIEAVGGPPASAGNVAPGPAALGEFLVDDLGPIAGSMSTYVSMLADRQPRFRRYEIDAMVDGQPVLFTDDPSIPNGQLAHAGQSPLVFYIQSIETDPVTGLPVPGATPGPWRRYVGSFGAPTGDGSLVDDGGNGFRFVMLIDRDLANDVTVQELRIVYRL